MVRIDGEDNIWTADKGSYVILKFSPEGRVLLALGGQAPARLAMKGSGPGQPATPHTIVVDGDLVNLSLVPVRTMRLCIRRLWLQF